MKRFFIAAAACLSVAASGGVLEAQTPGQPPAVRPPVAGTGEIRGSVVDAETNAPIFSASIAVLSRADGSLVTGAIARQDGTFRLEGLRPGTYVLRTSSVGYSSQTSDEIVITDSAPRVATGSIRLVRSAVALEGVDVTVDASAITLQPDRNSYRARDLAPAGGTASDVLRATPSVQVDGDGKVSLRGNENVAVQINGRPAPIRGAQLAAYLQQIPANMLERVEVVPNPSAKYDPEGMAGIINIVMKQNVDLGVSGGLTLGGAATAARYNASGNVGYQRGPLTLFSTYGYSADERAVTGINDRERFDALRAPLSYTGQVIAGETDNAGHNFSTNLDYRLGARDVLSGTLMLNRRGMTDGSLSAYTVRSGSGSLLERYDRLREADTRNQVVDFTLAHKRTWAPQKHELSTEFRVNRAEDRDRSGLWRQPVAVAGEGVPGRIDAETNDVDALSYQATAQTDYTRTLAARTKLETGYRGHARWLDRDFRVQNDPLGTGQWVPSDLSNRFEFDEQIHAAYGVLSHGVGKFDLQAGLRAEHASRDFALADQRFPTRYGSFFPSGVALFKPADHTQWKLSYSRRIRRPGTQELNPFPVFFDVQNVFLGNPELKPEFTDALELGYQRTGKPGSIQVSPFFRRTTDVIRFIISPTDTVAGREVTSISFKNLATSNSWGTDVNGSLRLGTRLSGFAGFNVFKMVTEGSGAESSLSSDAVTWSARVNGTAQVTKDLSFQAMYFYRAPMNIERGRFSSSSMANFSLRQKLRGEKASVALRVSDPFNTMRFRVEAGDETNIQITERQWDVRAVHLTFQYNFGQAPRIRQRRPDQGSEPQVGFPQ